MPPTPPSAPTPCPCQSTDLPAAPIRSAQKKGAKHNKHTKPAATNLPPYEACCGRYIDHWDTAPAPTAEHLMRSRYSAFVLGREDYLLATWHPSTRPATLELGTASTQWLGLQVKAHQPVDATHSEVEFVARYKTQGRATRLHERSRFVLEDGRWFYVDGDVD